MFQKNLQMKKIRLSIILFLCSCVSIAQGSWTQKTDLASNARRWAGGFGIGTKGYIAGGQGNGISHFNDFWEYDSANDTWAQKANVPGQARELTLGYTVGTLGYLLLGYSSGPYLNGHSYDPNSNSWGGLTIFPGAGRYGASNFAIGNKLYVVAGDTNLNAFQKDTWEYNIGTSTWSQKATFGGAARRGAFGFALGTKGYVGTGIGGSGLLNDVWEYDQTGNTWAQKNNFPGAARQFAAGFKIGSKGYVGTGYDGSLYQDYYEYDNNTDTWSPVASFPGNGRWGGIGFEINGKGYFGLGGTGTSSGNFKDWWEFTPGSSGMIDAGKNFSFTIFPNPSNGYFNIHCPSTKGELTIYDLNGKRVLLAKINSLKTPIDLSTRAKGAYIVELKSNDKVSSQKLILE